MTEHEFEQPKSRRVKKQLCATCYAYDAAGNLTQGVTGTGSHTYRWDAEGRLVSVDGGATQWLVYNALGQQVEAGPTPQQEILFDAAGQWEGWWVDSFSAFGVSGVFYLGGRQFGLYYNAPGSQLNGAWFDHVNALGSAAMGTKWDGSQLDDVVFNPWGEIWQHTALDDYHFAGFQFENFITDLDPTLYRSYEPLEGRWLSPDPMGGDLTNPQSLNRYAYALNNPETLTDPSGLDPKCLEADRGAVLRSGCASGPPPLGSGWGIGGYDPFGWMNVTVVAEDEEQVAPGFPGAVGISNEMWGTNGENLFDYSDGTLPIAQLPPVVLPFQVTVGNALSFFGLQLSPSSSGPAPLRSVNTSRITLPTLPSLERVAPPPTHTGNYEDYLGCVYNELVAKPIGDSDQAGTTLLVNVAAFALRRSSPWFLVPAAFYDLNLELGARATCIKQVYGAH